MAFPNIDGALVVVLSVVVVVVGRGLKLLSLKTSRKWSETDLIWKLQPEDWLANKRSRKSKEPAMVKLG